MTAYPYYQPYQQPYYPAPIQDMRAFQPQTPQSAAPQPQVQSISPASRPVGNREEANSVPADFSGAPMVFPDVAHDRVYVKRWDYTIGAADFAEYARVAPQEAQDAQGAPSPTYVTTEAFDALEARLRAIEDGKLVVVEKPTSKRRKEEAQDADE